MPPDEYRNEGTPSLSEGPDARGETFGSFGAFAKGTRRKGETISGRYRNNGYSLPPPNPQQGSYIAFSLQTDAREVARWQLALDQMRQDGSLERLKQRWLSPNTPR
jgi:hypothetical protein